MRALVKGDSNIMNMLQNLPQLAPSQLGDDSINFSNLDSSLNPSIYEPQSSRQHRPAASQQTDPRQLI